MPQLTHGGGALISPRRRTPTPRPSQPTTATSKHTHPRARRAPARPSRCPLPLRTAYIPRPLEYGPDRPQPPKPEDNHFDIEVKSLIELAEILA